MADPPIDDETMGETCWGDPKKVLNGFEWFLYVLMGKMISNIIDVICEPLDFGVFHFF